MIATALVSALLSLSLALSGLLPGSPQTGPTSAPSVAPSLSPSVAPSSAPAPAPPGQPALNATPPAPLSQPSRTFRPRPLTAAAEVAGLNFGVWAFLHYLPNAAYSYISWETIRDNIRDGWEWDRSRYFINFYHHPYHGYLYYSAGRANGLGFWGSCVSAFGGSFMWEMMMEKYRPSINDLITTTCGGIVYGEIGYRFSALVRKKDARGLNRIWREAVGAVLDPVGGANRLFNGREDYEPGLPGSPDFGRILNGELMLAGPVVTRSEALTGTRAAPLLGFTLRYGDHAGAGWTGRPFDVFTLAGRFRWGPDRAHLSLFIHGALIGKTLPGHNGSSHFLGVYQHYEYYGIDTMRVSGTSFTGGWASRFELNSGVTMRLSARLGWLGLGATDDFVEAERRNYNLGTGVTAAADFCVAAKGCDYVSLIWRHYSVFNLNVIGSRVGRETWDVVEGQIEFPVWSRLGMGFEAEYCSRRFDLRDLPSGHRGLVEARAFVSWQF